ncbi:HAMP domain-containing sensor histidine kinase [Malaciobacter mytili]|uniref:HAMP domain-containing sensor histidine kinase n=1 Tax=Malaciobacter mytili TaxID=603050 RepID=UPI0013E94FD7|nr:ATP-binding protein [Malaciobacter mytili]
MLILFKNKIFGKIFFFLLSSILFVLCIFFVLTFNLQKQSILDSLVSKARTITDAAIFVNKYSFIVDDEVPILEFVYSFVQANDEIKTFIVSKKNSGSLVVTNKNWRLVENLPPLYKNLQDEKETHEIEDSFYVKEKVLMYNFSIYFSGVHWGYIHLELSLDEYYKKVAFMYKQFFYLVILFLFSTILISFLIAKLFSTPIIKLNNVSKEIAKGNLFARSDITGNDEIGTFSKTFNKMIENLQLSQKQLKESHEELEQRVIQRTQELNKVNKSLQLKSTQLKELNDNLEDRVKEEISKQKEQEQMLIQQSRLAAMGEMIGNIAHQWRQPLNALSLLIQNIYFSYKMESLDDEFMQRSLDKANLLTKNMSKTIDDFRNFFRPNKSKELFEVNSYILKSIYLVESSFEHNNIQIDFIKSNPVQIEGFPNEFSQVILNILSNAKDALIEKKVANAKVIIKIVLQNELINVIIENNAGQIPEEILEKIYEPYFTTKEEGKGTGIGLYMSKTIIENNMNGKLFFKNIDGGVQFIIQIPKA